MSKSAIDANEGASRFTIPAFFMIMLVLSLATLAQAQSDAGTAVQVANAFSQPI